MLTYGADEREWDKWVEREGRKKRGLHSWYIGRGARLCARARVCVMFTGFYGSKGG